MRGIRACAVLLTMFLMTASLVMTQVGADPVPKTIQGEVLDASDGAVAFPGSAVFYIQNRTNEGQDTDVMYQSVPIEYYLSPVEDSITDWQFGDPGVMIVNVEHGTYGTNDRIGYVAYTTTLLDATGAQTFPAVTLQKIPVPTQDENGTGFINMSWSALPDPDSLIAGYKIYRSTTNASDLDWTLVGGSVNAPLTDLWFNDTTVSDGVIYYYSVKVCFVGYQNDDPIMQVDNYQNEYWGEGSAPMSSPGAPPTVDYILIMDAAGGAGSEIPDQTVNVGVTINGYAVAYSNTLGFLWDVSVTWTIYPAGSENATTTPGMGTFSDFWSGWIGGSVVWEADDGAGHIDVVNITINPPGVDTIDIVDTPGTGLTSILDQAVDVAVIITGYAAAFNNTLGYIGDVSVAWTVIPTGLENAFTDPGPATTADFNSGTIGGSVDWIADYNSGQATDTVIIDINPPTVDYITIVDTMATGAAEIPDNTVSFGFTKTGWAASFNNSIGYIGDVAVLWTVGNVGSTASTNPPGPSISSTFDADLTPGTATWTADDGAGHTDTVIYTIADWTVDYIEIVDTAGTGMTAYGPLTVGVGETITGYAAAFNTTAGYLYDIPVNWTVVNAVSNATTTPLLNSDTSDFWSGYLGGGATWTADDGNGHADSVSIAINPPEVDYIDIVDTSGTGLTPIADMPVNVGYTMTGYAASFNNSIGYLGDVSVDWAVVPTAGEDADTLPPSGTSSVFDSGTIGGSVTWIADYNTGQATDSVEITINPPTVDWIDIVDTAGTGATAILDQTVNVGVTITGYAAGFNTTSNYIGDVTVTWWIVPSGSEDASTDPGPADTADFNSGTVGGSVDWIANYSAGAAIDTVTIGINPPGVDYIDIVDTLGTGASPIPDQTVVVLTQLFGFAASFNNSIGYLGDVVVTWSVDNQASGSNAVTNPPNDDNSTFGAGTQAGQALWIANDGSGHIDTVTIDITLYITEYIEIVDSPGTGSAIMVDFSVGVGIIVRGYAAAFNSMAPGTGYLGDVIVTWTVTPVGGANSSSAPGSGTWTDFYSGFFGGTATWTADDGSGHTDTITVTIDPPVRDYIQIVDTAGTGATAIPTILTLGVGVTVPGYAAEFNNTIGYIGDISVAWSVTPSGGEDADTAPPTGLTSDFYSGTIGGSVDWVADDLAMPTPHTYTITITILPPTVDYIEIVDTAGTGATIIPDQSINVGLGIRGYAAGFNNSIAAYVMDVTATWTVTPSGGSNASTSPSSGTWSDFYSGFFGGSAIWTAEYMPGITATVTFTIPAPTVDYIVIVDMADAEILDQTVIFDAIVYGWAAGYNNVVGYLYDVPVTWSVNNVGGVPQAVTNPTTGVNSTFDSKGVAGTAIWEADDGMGHTDTVIFNITPWTIDYIEIVDTPNTGTAVIADQAVNVDYTITGYAAAFNSTGGGYLGDVGVSWSVTPVGGEDADTSPASGTTSDFYSGTIGGQVAWTADYGGGITDTVTIDINPPTIDYIYIVDTMDTGSTLILDQSVAIDTTITGYAAGFNSSIGYVQDVSVTWSVTPSGSENADTNPTSGTTSDFYSGTVGGSVTWTADYGGGITDTVLFTIPPPPVDYIEIVDEMGTGITAITDFSVGVGITVTGYAAAFNNVVGYIGDVSATWTITPTGTEDATSLPGTGDTSDFYSGTIGGTVDWEADYMGMTYTVTVTINPATIDYIDIVDTMDTGTTAIPDHAVDVGVTVTGYAAGFNNTIGYRADQTVTWSVTPTAGEDASTDPGPATTADFDSGTIGGSVTWTADLGGGITDSVIITINPPIVDYIDIVDTMDTGTTAIPDQSLGIGLTLTGYAAGFNNTIGYFGDVIVSWSITPTGSEDADTAPTSGESSVFDSGTIGGSVTWTAFYAAGITDDVVITISGAVIDYVLVMDAPGGTGNEVMDVTYAVQDTDNFYLVGFNTTTGFVRDITAVWTIAPTSGVGTITASGHETNFTALQVAVTTTCVVTGTDPVLSLSDATGTLTVLQPTVDSITIMDAALNAGAEVMDETYGVHRTTDTFHAASFNATVGYLGDVSVAWTSDTPAVGSVVATGTPTTFTAQAVTTNSECIVTAVYMVGIDDTTGTLTVLAPTVDYLQIEDAADNAGSEVTSLSLNDDETADLYAAGYNDTSGYVMDVDADWSTTLGTVSPTTGSSTTTYTPAAGTGTLTATYMGLTADVALTVTDVTGPPQPGAPSLEVVDGKAVITFPPSPPADVAEYQIQRMEEGTGTWVDVGPRQDPSTASYTDEDVEAGKTYNYRLVAYDDEGNPSSPSPTIQIKIPKEEEESPWILLLLIIIIVIIIIVLLLFLMTRKKEEEEEMPPEEPAPPEMPPEEEMPMEEAGLGAAAVAAPPPPGAAPEEEAAPEAHNCPQCGGEMEFIEDYDQYYCYNCGKYDSEFDEEGGEGDEGEPPSEEPSGEEPPEEGGTEFEENPPE